MTSQDKIEILLETGFSAKDLARELQVTESYIYNLRAGRRKASNNVMLRLNSFMKNNTAAKQTKELFEQDERVLVVEVTLFILAIFFCMFVAYILVSLIK